MIIQLLSKRAQIAFRFGAYRIAIWALLHSDLAPFAMRFGVFWNFKFKVFAGHK